MPDFIKFKSALQRQFSIMASGDLFRTRATGDSLWETYLNSFPPGTNPIFRERTEHDCSCCHHFIKTAGNIVGLQFEAHPNPRDNKLVLTSIWDFEEDLGPPYDEVAYAMSQAVRSKPIDNIALFSDPNLGTDKNYEQFPDHVHTWEHFHIPIIFDESLIGPKLAESRADHDVLARSLTELTLDSCETVLELIANNSLYRGAEHKRTVEQFTKLKQEYENNLQDSELFAWSKLSSTPGPVLRIRNTAIGTLLTDLSDNMDLEAAVSRFESTRKVLKS